MTEEKTSELEGIISESEARKKPKTSVTEGKLFTDVFPKARALSGMSVFPNHVIIFPKSTPSLRNISLPSNLLPSTRIS